ncbi:MAG: DUF2304 domain-containing protein [Actinomycetota bacterium]
MNWNIAVTGIVAGLLMIALIVELVRRGSLGERYAILWILLGISIIVLSAWPALLQKLADVLRIYYPPSIIFGLAFLFIFGIMIHFSAVLSRQSKGYNRMVQRLAVLEEKLLRLVGEEAEGEDGGEGDDADARDG